MALVPLPTRWGPGYYFKGPAGWAVSTIALNDSDNKVAAIFKAKKAGNINTIGVRVTSKGSTGTSTTIIYNYMITTLDISGNPSGVAAFGSAAVQKTVASHTNSAYQEITLPTPAVVDEGDLVVIEILPEGTDPPTAANGITVNYRIQGGNTQNPYCMDFGTAWTINANLPAICAKYDDGTFLGIPYTGTVETAAFGSGSTPNELGAMFTPPFGATCVGMGLFTKAGARAQTGRLGLYDNSGNLVRHVDMPANAQALTSSYGEYVDYWVDGGYDLVAGTSYRVAELATSADTRRHLEWSFPTAAARDAIPGGLDWQSSTRTNSGDTGAWTQVNTKVPLFFLLLTDVDLTAAPGGGGGSGGQGAIFI